MFIPVSSEDNILNERPFTDEETRYNLFHRIENYAQAIKLKDPTGNALLYQTPGYNAWMWVNSQLSEEEQAYLVHNCCESALALDLPGITGDPRLAEQFAALYAERVKKLYQRDMMMIAYRCSHLKKPDQMVGTHRLAEAKDANIVAKYLAGFICEAQGDQVTPESQFISAQKSIVSGKLYVWEVEGQVVSMAAVTHRAAREACINSVYTPPEQRKRGYASALVAQLCEMVLNEGLMPMLYADASNPVSNKVYRNIGFQPCGYIQEIKFK